MFEEGDEKYFDPEQDLNFEETEEQFPINYDLEAVFDEKIQPQLKTIINLCREYGIPMVCSFQYSHSKAASMLCNTAILPVGRSGEKIISFADQLSK